MRRIKRINRSSFIFGSPMIFIRSSQPLKHTALPKHASGMYEASLTPQYLQRVPMSSVPIVVASAAVSRTLV